MTRAPDRPSLVADVFTADGPEQDDLLLNQLLGEVRARRRRRLTVRALSLAALLAVGAWWIRPLPMPPAPPVASTAGAVAAAPLVVHTTPLLPGHRVHTLAGVVPVVRSAPQSSVALVTTVPLDGVAERLDDQKLFALLGGRAALLKPHPDGTAELILLNPRDREGFPALR